LLRSAGADSNSPVEELSAAINDLVRKRQ